MKKAFQAILRYLKRTDLWLWILCIGLSSLSIILLSGITATGYAGILGVSTRTILVQIFATCLGILGAFILSKFDYHTLIKLWKIHVPLAYILVLLTFFIGTGTAERLSDKSWIEIPFLNLNIQPAEFLKISFILAFAYHLHLVSNDVNRPTNLIGLCVHGAIPILLIHFQGDDGTALVFAAIFVCMVFAAGINWKYIVSALGALVVGFPLIWIYVMNDYQKQRILVLFDESLANPQGDYYQQYWAKLAIGSGQVWGKGIFSDSHRYIPEVHNDFIFAFIGESLGFVGCLAVIALIITLCVKILGNIRTAEDFMGRMICVGVFAMIAFQSIVNIGMCLSALPVIGITLPFLSYGGSSVLASYLSIGLVQSVRMRTPKSWFDNG